MRLDLEGRIALVTGASSGIGEGVARCLAEEGAHLVISGRDGAALEALAADLSRKGRVRHVRGDVTDAGDIRRIAKAAGEAAILVNCAGGSRPTKWDSGEEVWEESFTLNFDAARRLSEFFIPGMLKAGWGRIINISGSMEPRGLNAAAAAKAALHVWAKGLSCDLAPHGITVNSIAPGRINSRQILNNLHPDEEKRRQFIADNIPAGFFGEPHDIGHMVAFLASPLARYITGAVIPIDGGMRRSAM
jgi:3-oxoacyl-[acyl-carrier protein] reductase